MWPEAPPTANSKGHYKGGTEDDNPDFWMVSHGGQFNQMSKCFPHVLRSETTTCGPDLRISNNQAESWPVLPGWVPGTEAPGMSWKGITSA